MYEPEGADLENNILLVEMGSYNLPSSSIRTNKSNLILRIIGILKTTRKGINNNEKFSYGVFLRSFPA